MKPKALFVLMIAAAMSADGAEPVGTKKERASRTVPPIAGKPATPTPPSAAGTKSVSSTSSVFTSSSLTLAPNPAVLYPDLVPKQGTFTSVCYWIESQGQTCESECPPLQVDLRFGVRNASQRALNGPGKVKVRERATGQLLKEWSFDSLPAQGEYLPATLRRLIVRCHQGTTIGGPPPTHELVVETTAQEANANNNTAQFLVGPNDQLILP